MPPSEIEYIALSIIFGGLVTGGIYALVSAGLSVSMGGLRNPNISLGSFFTLATYVIFYLVVLDKLNFFIGMFVTLALFGVIFLFLDRILISRYYLKPNPDLTYLVISIGIVTVVNGVFDSVIGQNPESVSTPYLNMIFPIGSFPINGAEIISIALEFGVLAAVLYFMRYTKQGRALRAMVQDKEVTSLMGVNLVGLSRQGFLISSLLSVVSGTLFALLYSFEPTTGVDIITIVFTIVLVGGIGSIFGALVVSLFFGFIESVVTYFLDPYLSIFIFYAIVFATLFLKPKGLFSK